MTHENTAPDVQEYLLRSVTPGDPVEVRLMAASKVGLPRAFYQIIHDGRLIGVTNEVLSQDMYAVLKVNDGWNVGWPEEITGLHVESVDTVAGTAAAGSNAGLGPSGIWLRPRIGGMGDFGWEDGQH